MKPVSIALDIRFFSLIKVQSQKREKEIITSASLSCTYSPQSVYQFYADILVLRCVYIAVMPFFFNVVSSSYTFSTFQFYFISISSWCLSKRQLLTHGRTFFWCYSILTSFPHEKSYLLREKPENSSKEIIIGFIG